MTDAAYWDDLAGSFDDEPDHGLRDPATRRAWADLLARHLPAPPARIADLGCGTGSLAVLLAEAGHDVTGLDQAPRMIEAARRKAAAAGVRVTLAVGDAASPQLPAEAFDVVLVRHVLWAMPVPGEALATWARLLAPGGRLLLVEGRWHTGGGLAAADVEALLRSLGRRAVVEPLADPALWGGPIQDERYLVVSVTEGAVDRG